MLRTPWSGLRRATTRLTALRTVTESWGDSLFVTHPTPPSAKISMGTGGGGGGGRGVKFLGWNYIRRQTNQPNTRAGPQIRHGCTVSCSWIKKESSELERLQPHRQAWELLEDEKSGNAQPVELPDRERIGLLPNPFQLATRHLEI
jgi:hypothetical protein